MILVFGKTGQVTRELARLLPDADFLGRDRADLTDPAACADVLRQAAPRAVINLAAYTAVDRAETESETARLVNTDAPAAMAQAAAELRVPFLHVSTDYVFDGSGDVPWRETDATGPLGVYGLTKRQGEQGVAAAHGQHAILRTSWVFSAQGANFVKTMLRLGREREELLIVADQIGGPTPAAAIAGTLAQMARQMLADPGAGGIYHFSGSPDVSWAGFAREIFAQAGLGCRVRDIATADYPTPAQRPRNSRLDCSRLSQDFDISRPDWRRGLQKVLLELETRT